MAETPAVTSPVTYKLFAGSANPKLAEKVAAELGMTLGQANIGRFNDGECNIQLGENVRNTHVFLLQSTCPPVNDSLMELFLMVRCFRRASARTVTAIVPYYGYARQDRKTTARVPISASDVAMLLEAAGVDRMLSLDLHCGQIQGFFHHAPVDNMHALVDHVPFFVKDIISEYGDNPIAVVSPDAGGVARAKMFMETLSAMNVQNISLAITIKHRRAAGEVEAMNIVGEIKGKHCIIVDDMIDTAGTLCKSADSLKEMGALSVSACCTHALFSGPALERIGKSALAHLVVSDTIPVKDISQFEEGSPAHTALKSKIHVVSCAALLGRAIRSINSGTSVSNLFAVKSNK
eukprot:CAMPEP_0181326990 /NCGR_PEP_ID=MMETSP1101-20121128/21828_1 /TAXON_ID=46948 /ORGANISM="Rhodomonas abbreviata, Strain Caron Lab Isolate" /LENGTH=348 /DNA_ID=CAMNT_0023435551 /DNA_START=40 /DNA_END=1086 /DNA_ORIENTATION=-